MVWGRGLRAGVAGAAMLLAMPAFAQDDDFDSLMSNLTPEAYCVFDVLSQSSEVKGVADVWMASDASVEDTDKIGAVLDGAVKECADSYGWDTETSMLGATIGIHGSVVEVVTGDMLQEGLEQEQVEAVFNLFGLMEDKDTAIFTEAAWQENYAFRKKMYRALVLAGLPNEDAALEHAMFVLESSAVTTDTILKWIDLKAANVADATPAPKRGSAKSKSNKRPSTTPRAPKMEIAATGTGWYVAPGGYMVTNAHVVDGCKMVTLKSGAQLEVLDVQVEEDLALLKGMDSVSHLSLRDGAASAAGGGCADRGVSAGRHSVVGHQCDGGHGVGAAGHGR